MERIAITTDIHADRYVYVCPNTNKFKVLNGFHSLCRTMNSIEADYLIICGDICRREELNYVFQHIKPNVKKVIIVYGNHEFIDSNLDVEIELPDHVVCLKVGDEFITDNGLKIIGDTLWTYIPPDRELLIQSALPEYSAIMNGRTITAFDVNEWHEEAKNFIFNTDADIVISHHVPTWDAEHPSFKGDKLNYAFYSELITEIKNSNFKLWAFGHTHYNYDRVLGNTRLINSAYPRITTIEL